MDAGVETGTGPGFHAVAGVVNSSGGAVNGRVGAGPGWWPAADGDSSTGEHRSDEAETHGSTPVPRTDLVE